MFLLLSPVAFSALFSDLICLSSRKPGERKKKELRGISSAPFVAPASSISDRERERDRDKNSNPTENVLTPFKAINAFDGHC